jgi:hypothetical protein
MQSLENFPSYLDSIACSGQRPIRFAVRKGKNPLVRAELPGASWCARVNLCFQVLLPRYSRIMANSCSGSAPWAPRLAPSGLSQTLIVMLASGNATLSAYHLHVLICCCCCQSHKRGKKQSRAKAVRPSPLTLQNLHGALASTRVRPISAGAMLIPRATMPAAGSTCGYLFCTP